MEENLTLLRCQLRNQREIPKLVFSKKKKIKRSVVSSCLERMIEIKAGELRLEELTQTD